MKTRIFIILAILSVAFGCGPRDKFVLIETEYGNIKIKLYKETPLHQENFIKLAKQGFFDDLLFHRVIQNFMIQAGDPDSRNAKEGIQLGSGGPGYTIPAEFNARFYHHKGALSAARMGDDVNPAKESSGSQFFIVQGKTFTEEQLSSLLETKKANRAGAIFRRMFNEQKETLMKLRQEGKEDEFSVQMASLQEKAETEAATMPEIVFSEEQKKTYASVGGYPSLDNEYTVFGEVVEGLDILDKIAAVDTDNYDRPLKDVKFRITVL